MQFLRFFNVLGAFRDLGTFLTTRRPHDFLFMALSAAIVMLVLYGFWKDSSFPRPYRPNIIYVENWRLDRTEAEIKAQQKIDMAARAKAEAEFEQRAAKRRAEFQKVDNWLTERGI